LVTRLPFRANRILTNILDGLGDARVSCQTVVMVGVKDVQSDLLIVRDIEQSLVAKEVTIL